jgi:hypothetical protein
MAYPAKKLQKKGADKRTKAPSELSEQNNTTLFAPRQAK